MSREHLPRILLPALAFALLYLYALAVIDPRTAYISLQLLPPFSTGTAFLRGFLVRPGGPLEYAAAFLSQWFYFGWLGALIAAGHVWLIGWATMRLAERIGMPRAYGLAAVPAFLILVLYGRYEYHLHVGLGILAALACFLLYARATRRTVLPSASRFLFLSLALYYAAGGALLLFGLLCALFESQTMRRRILPVACLAWAAAVPLAAGRLLQMNPTVAFLRGAFPLALLGRTDARLPWMLFPLLHLSFPAVFVLKRLPDAAGLRRLRPRALPSGRLRSAITALAWLLALLLGRIFLDLDSRTCLRMNYYAEHGRWRDILREADGHRARTRRDLPSHAVLRALCRTGLLPAHASSPRTVRFLRELTSEEGDRQMLSQSPFCELADLCGELGRVNEAEHAYFEFLSHYGAHPALIKRLVRTLLARDQEESARVFLEALRRDIIWRGWADRYLRSIERAEPYPEEETSRLRSSLVTRDSVLRFNGDAYFLDALAANPRNQLAFECLMTFYLMAGDLEGFVRNLPRLDDAGYGELPRTYEEAVLLYQTLRRSEVLIPGHRVSGATIERYRDFQRDLALGKTDEAAMLRLVGRKYADSYFAYYLLNFLYGPPDGQAK